jgi:uncharacterized protein YdhG (YjbR/CyaY superfamily)
MEIFNDYLLKIEDLNHRAKVTELLIWISNHFSTLIPKIAWNQPMFTDHGTFIIGFSIAKHHIAVAPERVSILKFSEDIIKSGYDHTNELMRISWDKPLDFTLLEKMIAFNIEDKANCTTFWRK